MHIFLTAYVSYVRVGLVTVLVTVVCVFRSSTLLGTRKHSVTTSSETPCCNYSRSKGVLSLFVNTILPFYKAKRSIISKG